MSNYPLCEKAGLTIYEGDGYIDDNIKADAVERALERLKCVYIEPEPKEPAVMPNLGNQSPELGELALTKDDVLSAIKMHWQHENIAKQLNEILTEKLSRAPVVYWQHGGAMHDVQNSLDTHQARLVCVTPIAKADTAESILREIVAEFDADKFTPDLLERARALLAKGGE